MPVRSVIVDSAGGLHAARFSRIAVGLYGQNVASSSMVKPTIGLHLVCL